MNTSELKSYIQNGKLDSTLCSLYEETKLEAQRLRYLSVVDSFREKYGEGNDLHLFSVPGRSEISGNHTDHNYGKVLAGSIDLDIIALAEAADDNTIRIQSEGFPEDIVPIHNIKIDPTRYYTSYAVIEGMCDGMIKAGCKVGGLRACTTSNVFKGSGLSSSAAFEVMVGNMLRTLYRNTIDNTEIAKIAQYSENIFFGKPCGLMDQMACATGGFIAIDFANPQSPIVEKLSFDLSAMGYSLCIVDTHGNHADLNEDYASIPREMKAIAEQLGKTVLRETDRSAVMSALPALRESCGDRAVLRTLHFFAENDRVTAQTEALRQGNIADFFAGVRASGNSSFKYLQNVYTNQNPAEQGLSLALALTEAFLDGIDAPTACRVHGGGFAGTIQAFLPAERAADLAALLDPVFGAGATHILRIRKEGAICIL